MAVHLLLQKKNYTGKMSQTQNFSTIKCIELLNFYLNMLNSTNYKCICTIPESLGTIKTSSVTVSESNFPMPILKLTSKKK